ncbi:MAG: hypothetical protein FJZ01_22970, partial [Candidatus Sericytochromatia bacterium]|nr:hypothetical protein [Candidatus Tanganyikabacteria bacterium]
GIGVAAAGRPGGFGPGRCQPLAAWRHVHSGCWRYRGAGDRLAGEPAGSAASRLDRELQTVASGSRPFFPQFDRNPLAVASETRAAGALEPGAVATRVAQALEEGALQLAIGDPDAPANWPRALLVWQPGKGTPAGLGGDAFLKHCLGTGSEKVPIQRAGPGPALVHCRPSPRGKLDLAVGIGARPDGAIQLADILLPTGGRDVFAALAREISDLSPLAFPGPVEDLVMVPREPQPAPGLPPGDPGPRFALASRDYARLADHLGTADPGARPACAGLSWVALARLPDAGEFEAAPARGQAP